MIRTQQIGEALAEKHLVSILDGGRALPFPAKLQRVQVPRIARGNGVLVSLDNKLSLPRAMAARQQVLSRMLRDNTPDIILVEHFPFSKWELQNEIESLLSFARGLNPGLKVIASLRDISPPTRYEAEDNYEGRVLGLLQRHFDALLVHADPALCTLDESFPASRDISIPVFYTGIVANQSTPLQPDRTHPLGVEEGYVVASVGGGADDGGLLSRVMRAWQQLVDAKAVGSRSLLLFGGLDGRGTVKPRLVGADDSVYCLGFDPDFRYWLQGASLSISCAGYNTCANLLVTGIPALLMPNKRMSDQEQRARLLANRGVAKYVPACDSGTDPLSNLILEGLQKSPAAHDIKIDGARESVRCIEALSSGLHAQ